ncbi:MAG: RNA-binding transcriptional accessory protein [Deltaproteobacteria bacterium]|jgi:uncharacterized protein|nr:RNA-binding transcriptional accessory protein [Deltaproteobacteria bacterium]
MEKFATRLAENLKLRPQQVAACIELLIQEATVPFIARYRKESTGGLDEVKVSQIFERLTAYGELIARRESILKSLTSKDQLTPELKEKFLAAETLSELEDIYLPWRPKRRTRAALAKERGLEPLAARVFEQDPTMDPVKMALYFINNIEQAKGLSPEEALKGARDILAERINENAVARAKLRELFEKDSLLKSKVIAGKEVQGAKYENYFNASEHILKLPSHRYLAMRRGEAEGILSLSIQPDPQAAIALLIPLFVKNDSPCGNQVYEALVDAYRRLLSLSMETEIRMKTKKKADQEAIEVFAKNFYELLMAPPWGKRAILAVDPGLKTGCKLVALSQEGDLLEYMTCYPHTGEQGRQNSKNSIVDLVERHKLTAIAIGNGTGGRETEKFISEIKELQSIPCLLVSETGASIYSASDEARSEFPQLDLTIRSAVSIGRRLIDPLAELVKIDPRSIGVGQYQHDVDQLLLKNSLDSVVISCVNQVGVEVNSASERLLSYVSGLGPALAKNFVEYRKEHGPFKSREDFRKVHRLGPKAFEQCAGFLRIRGAENPLDASAVHPESYPVVEKMASDLGVSIIDLIRNRENRRNIILDNYKTATIGIPTLKDIMLELDKPGRDPRKILEPLTFAPEIHKPEDLNPGMRIPGVVVNVTAFGAFVDIGVHLDGLIHLSELADRYINAPSEVVKVGQKVLVTVLVVDLTKGRISLSLKKNHAASEKKAHTQISHMKLPSAIEETASKLSIQP